MVKMIYVNLWDYFSVHCSVQSVENLDLSLDFSLFHSKIIKND